MIIITLLNIVLSFAACIMLLCMAAKATHSYRRDKLPYILLVGCADVALECYVVHMHIPLPIAYFAMMFILFFECLLLFHTEIRILLWCILSFTFTAVCIRGIVATVYSLMFGISLYETTHKDAIRRICTLITLLILLFVFYIYKHVYPTARITHLINSRSQFRLVIIMEAVTALYLLMLSFSYYFDITVSWFTYFVLISVLAIQAGHCIMFERALRISLWLEEDLKQEILSSQLNRQLTHYKAYQKHIKSFADFSRSYYTNTGALRHKIQNNDIAGALELLDAADDNIKQMNYAHKEYSNNMLVDAILEDYGSKCIESGIEFYAKVFIPTSIALSDLELCRLFANIFTNAYESCQKMPNADDAKISFTSQYENNWLTIYANNTFGHVLHFSGNTLLTDKKDTEQHGFGLDIIRSIIEQHGGFVELSIIHNTEFCLKAHLPIDKQ